MDIRHEANGQLVITATDGNLWLVDDHCGAISITLTAAAEPAEHSHAIDVQPMSMNSIAVRPRARPRGIR